MELELKLIPHITESLWHQAPLLIMAVAFMLLFVAVYAVIWGTSYLGDLMNERQINAALEAYRRRAEP